MDNTNLIFIALHRDDQIEYYIDINKIVAITPNKDGGTIISTVSTLDFYCKESVNKIIKLMDEAFKKTIIERSHFIKRKIG